MPDKLPIRLRDLLHQRTVEGERIEVRISREELVVLSFPGPDRSIRLADFTVGRGVSRRYRNRRIGEFLKELGLTEGRSTGVPKILKAMRANGSPAPAFETDEDRLAYVIRLPVHPLAESPVIEVTPEVTPEILGMLAVMQGDMSRSEIMAALGLKEEKHFRENYLHAGIASGVIEMTQPDKPRSSRQRYRLTAGGENLLKARGKG